MGQNNNHKSNFHFLILGCKSFAVNYSLKSGTHKHHQTLGFIPGDALPGLYCNRLQFLLVLGAFSLQFCLQQVKCMLNRIQVRWLTCHCITVHFFPFKNFLVAFAVCFGSLSICTVKRRPMSSEAFGWIWADNIARNTSEFILLLLSAVTSSINTREPVPLAAIHAHAMTLPPPCIYVYIMENVYIRCIMCDNWTLITASMSNSTLCVLSICMCIQHIVFCVSMYCLYVNCFWTVWSTLSITSLTKAHVLWWCDNKSDLIWFDSFAH